MSALRTALAASALVALSSQAAFAEKVLCQGRDDQGFFGSLVRFVLDPQLDRARMYEVRETAGGGPGVAVPAGSWRLIMYHRDASAIRASGFADGGLSSYNFKLSGPALSGHDHADYIAKVRLERPRSRRPGDRPAPTGTLAREIAVSCRTR